MNKIFIVDCYKNPKLLNFVQAKVFFNAKNEGIDWASDIEVVNHTSEIVDKSGIIINSNQFITTDFRKKYKSVDTLVDARNDPDLINFDTDYDYIISHRPPFAAGSKQLYILENLYKVVLRSKKLIYLDNTEPVPTQLLGSYKHFYGLASGWKSTSLVKHLGLNNLESITIYDKCVRQLEHQQFLHSCNQLPDTLTVDPPYCGEYLPPEDIKKFWPQWSSSKVKFEVIDLFLTPVFPENSLIWISNVFKYEPTIFEYGWKECKDAKQRLIDRNKTCTII